MNFSSAAGEWVNSTSASPRRPSSSACPLPAATALTSIPVFSLKSGSSTSSKPVSRVLVVVARTTVSGLLDLWSLLDRLSGWGNLDEQPMIDNTQTTTTPN